MRIYIVRHADPDYANNTITPDGHLEAKALAKRFLREGLDRIYSSPIGRALHTMQYTAEALGMEANIEEWTRELSGMPIDLEQFGKSAFFNLHGEIIREDLSLLTRDTWHQIPKIEGNTKIIEACEAVQRGSDEFFKRHGYERVEGRYRCIRPNRDKIAVFCHGGFGVTWLAHLLEISIPLAWSGFWLPASSVTTILFDERSSEWAVPRCIGLGDVSHLYEAGLPVKPRGIVANYF